MMKNILMQELALPPTKDDDLSVILKMLLDKDPAKRPSAEDLI